MSLGYSIFCSTHSDNYEVKFSCNCMINLREFKSGDVYECSICQKKEKIVEITKTKGKLIPLDTFFELSNTPGLFIYDKMSYIPK